MLRTKYFISKFIVKAIVYANKTKNFMNIKHIVCIYIGTRISVIYLQSKTPTNMLEYIKWEYINKPIIYENAYEQLFLLFLKKSEKI